MHGNDKPPESAAQHGRGKQPAQQRTSAGLVTALKLPGQQSQRRQLQATPSLTRCETRYCPEGPSHAERVRIAGDEHTERSSPI
jgi:hypothetical protein